MRKVVSTIIVVICIAVIAVAAFKIITYYMEASKAEEAFDNLRPPTVPTEEKTTESEFDKLLPHYQALKEQNPDFVGWLTVEGTDVDYPVMQTVDDLEYYLDKDFDKNYSAPGTLFASDISDVNTPSDVVLIYGHNMKSGAMFSSLKNLLDQEALDANGEIIFDTLTNRNEYQIVSVFRTEVNTGSDSEFKYYNYSNFLNADEFNQFLSSAKSKSSTWTDIQPVFGDKILLLSTCEDTNMNGRIVVMAVRTSP